MPKVKKETEVKTKKSDEVVKDSNYFEQLEEGVKPLEE